MVNLSELLAKDTATVALKHPKTAVPMDAFITVSGPASDTYRKARQAMTDRRMAANAAGQPIDAATIEANARELMAQCVLDWTGLIGPDGAEMPCTVENVRKVLSTPGLYWLKDQIDEAINTVGNFLTA